MDINRIKKIICSTLILFLALAFLHSGAKQVYDFMSLFQISGNMSSSSRIPEIADNELPHVILEENINSGSQIRDLPQKGRVNKSSSSGFENDHSGKKGISTYFDAANVNLNYSYHINDSNKFIISCIYYTYDL